MCFKILRVHMYTKHTKHIHTYMYIYMYTYILLLLFDKVKIYIGADSISYTPLNHHCS